MDDPPGFYSSVRIVGLSFSVTSMTDFFVKKMNHNLTISINHFDFVIVTSYKSFIFIFYFIPYPNFVLFIF